MFPTGKAIFCLPVIAAFLFKCSQIMCLIPLSRISFRIKGGFILKLRDLFLSIPA